MSTRCWPCGEKVYCALNPGDAVFFHANLLHASDQNVSENARWSMICCYNKASNNPYKESHHPFYTKLHKVADEKIMEVARTDSDEASMEFANLAEEDESAKSLS